MIYDCFIFNNELDILDIRFHELNSVVDKFVLVESTVTHVNRKKPLYYKMNQKRYKEFEDKIIHIVVDDTPDVSLAWIINDFQFSQMIRGLKNCKPNDVILFGDVDEIPKAEKIKEWMNQKGKHKLFIEKLSYFYLNLSDYAQKPVNGTHMMLFRELIKYKTTWIAKYSKVDVEILNGGWHFSYISDIKGIEKKIESMAHQEFNNEKYNTPEKIRSSIINQKDLFNNGLKFRVESVSLLPKYVQDNQQKFKKYLLTPNNIRNKFIVNLISLCLDFKDFVRIKLRKVNKLTLNT
ncbi:MAG TPA: hypothetical protein VES68_02855 [Candidatus Sulfotelmatobacter sp.]|nr:hypothetical protein [Candidatus Sulfotelmatobacter sp.]